MGHPVERYKEVLHGGGGGGGGREGWISILIHNYKSRYY